MNEIPSDDHSHNEQFSQRSQAQGASFEDLEINVSEETLYIVDVIVDETMATEIRESEGSIRTLLSGELHTYPSAIGIRLHVAEMGQRKPTIIFPLLGVNEPERGPSDSISIGELTPAIGASDCRVELISVAGLDHLFKPVSLRDDFHSARPSSPSRDTESLKASHPEERVATYANNGNQIDSGAFDASKSDTPSSSRSFSTANFSPVQESTFSQDTGEKQIL